MKVLITTILPISLLAMAPKDNNTLAPTDHFRKEFSNAVMVNVNVKPESSGHHHHHHHRKSAEIKADEEKDDVTCGKCCALFFSCGKSIAKFIK